MSPPPPIAEVLDSLAGEFARLGLAWYLFGAQAVVIWGRPRTSADIDVTVDLDPARVPELVDELARAGFQLRIRDGVEAFVARTRVLPFTHAPTQFPVDVVLAGPGLEEEFLDRSLRVKIGHREIPVISPEDLVVTKILAGRPKDLEDVRGIIATRGRELQIEQIRATLATLEAALAQSDLLPLLEKQLGAVR